MKQTPFFAK